MPFRQAHWFLLALFPLAGLAFWPGYLSQVRASSWEFHAHGVTATLWLILLVAQSWTIHRGERRLHRTLGFASLALFPLFLVGGVGMFVGMAERFVDGVSPFHTLYAARLAWVDVVTVAGFAYCYFEGLRQRRRVHAHSRYLLATVIFLLPPVLARVMPILPPLSLSGPQELWKLAISFHLANLVTAALAFALALTDRRHGRPFVIAGVLTLLAQLLYQTVGATAAWEQFFAAMAGLPRAPLVLAAGLAGLLISYAGWVAGKRPTTAGAAATL